MSSGDESDNKPAREGNTDMAQLESSASPLPPPPQPPPDYAPSPNTSSQALTRAQQLRVQSLLRKLLLELDENVRIDTLRVLRKTLRELDFQLSWLTQVDFLETLERMLRNSSESSAAPEEEDRVSWRLVHDATQLLIESVARLPHEIDRQLVESIVPSVVENLGHQRSEVRRASLLLLNALLHQHTSGGGALPPRANLFKLILRLFIDYGLTNYRNKQAQRGAILSLPLLMSEQLVRREDLGPLISCLSELLLVDSNEQLFYSLYLAMQRLHLMMGDDKFETLLGRCEPEAAHLYRQAASRQNSLVPPAADGANQVNYLPPTMGAATTCGTTGGGYNNRRSSQHAIRTHEDQAEEAASIAQQQQQPSVERHESHQQQHVTFESSASGLESDVPEEERQQASERQQDSSGQHKVGGEETSGPGEGAGEPRPPGSRQSEHEEEEETLAYGTGFSSSPTTELTDSEGSEAGGKQRVGVAKRQFSSDVSSTCSSDAHLVNPAHYMTKAALAGNPLDHYDEIHHVDHSNMQSLAINDFGPICNTPTMEFTPQLRATGNVVQSSTGAAHHHYNCLESDRPSLYAAALASHELKFGIFPKQLIQVALQSPRASDRYEAMQELMCIVRESPINHLAILMTYFDSFLEQFLSKILLNRRHSQQRQQQREQANDFKLELIGIDMIETIIIKTKVSTMQYIRPIVSLLMRALIVDSQQQQQPVSHQQNLQHHHNQLTATPSIFRESTCRVLHKMMAYLPPQHVIDALFEHKHQRAPVVREEAVNRVTAAILEYDRNEFNLTKLCYHILPMLADPSASVRLASLECIATLAHALGPERIGSLLTAAEAVQSGCDYDGLLLGAINARLMRHTLPRCQSNGIVRYALKPHLGLSAYSSGGDKSELPADVRWVLEAPAAHQQHPGGPYYHPHAHTGHNHSHNHLQQQQQQVKQQQVQANLRQQEEVGVEHQHHRLGVYSPPTQAERRRRSSVGLALLQHSDEPLPVGEQVASGSHRHPHHHHNHHSIARHHRSTSMVAERQRSGDQDQQATRSSRSNSDQSKAEVLTQQQNGLSSSTSSGGAGGSQDKCETHQPSRAQLNEVAKKSSENESPTGTTAKRRESRLGSLGVTAPGKRRESVGKLEQRTPSGPSGECNCGDRRQHSKQTSGSRQQAGLYRRSNSQDSVSSTDTNKVLFQYYLGKFRQSLAESPGNQAVLPSDSIIYTDVEQAYELTRHRTRFQQTSFDYEADAVGRVPEGLQVVVGPPQPLPPPPPVIDSQAGRRKSTTSQRTIVSKNGDNQQSQQKRESDMGQSRPEVDECPTSGSESPQTVFENSPNSVTHQSQEQAQPQPQQQQQRQRPILTRSGKSIQRQATIERDLPLSETPATQETERSPTPAAAAAAASRRQSAASNASGGERNQRHAPSAHSSRAGSLGDEQQQRQQQQPNSGRQSRANSGENFASHRQRSQSIASRASSSGGANGLQLVDRRGQEDAAEAEATTVSSSTASDISRPSLETGEQSTASGGRERRRRRSSSQRRRSEHATAPRPPSDRDDGRGASESEQQRQAEEEARVRRRASRSQPPVARARPAAAAAAAVDNNSQQQDVKSQASRSLASSGGQVRLVPIGRQGPAASDSRRACSVSPSLSNSVNIRHILENVAQVEGPFAEPQLAHKVALSALDSPCWSTKVEGILALIRLMAFHGQQVVLGQDTPGRLHEIVTKVAEETRNLRSTVARSAIFALGDFCSRLERAIEPELDMIVHALLLKSNENTAFIRDDIRRSLGQMVDHLTPWRLASALIHHGAQHKSVHVRRMASQFVAALVERLGPARCLVGAREISAQLLPAAAKFAQDQSPHTRFHGRLILAKLMHHNSFERLLRRNLTSQLYRSTIGIIESVKRRGPGEPPADLA